MWSASMLSQQTSYLLHSSIIPLFMPVDSPWIRDGSLDAQIFLLVENLQAHLYWLFGYIKQVAFAFFCGVALKKLFKSLLTTNSAA